MKYFLFYIFCIIELFCIYGRTQEFDVVQEIHEVIRDLTSVAPNRKIYKDFDYGHKFAEDILEASIKNDVPDFLLTVNIYKESSFRKDALSENTEWYGLGQMHGVASVNCDIETRQGQLNCSASWLRFCFEKCKTWRGAITAYKTKGDCKPKTKLLKRRVNSIIYTWQKYEKQRQSIRDEIISDFEFYGDLRNGI